VFSGSDRPFDGQDEDGANLNVLIPQKFWKLVVAEVNGALAAFSFLLEQKLTNVAFENEEFKVTSEWTPYLISVSDLEGLLGIVKFPKVIHDADNSGDPGGQEALHTKGVEVYQKKVAAAS
jgi:DNA/RNA endonuclease G (NUC1)